MPLIALINPSIDKDSKPYKRQFNSLSPEGKIRQKAYEIQNSGEDFPFVIDTDQSIPFVRSVFDHVRQNAVSQDTIDKISSYEMITAENAQEWLNTKEYQTDPDTRRIIELLAANPL